MSQGGSADDRGSSVSRHSVSRHSRVSKSGAVDGQQLATAGKSAPSIAKFVATVLVGALAFALAFVTPPLRAQGQERLVIGSKAFSESVILGDILATLLRHRGVVVTHRRALGGSAVLFKALQRGDIDAYPEYTGTLKLELLAVELKKSHKTLRDLLRDSGLVLGNSLGFRNNYGLAMRRKRAAQLGVRTLSDLRAHPQLRYGFTTEFLRRRDGWPGLKQAYGLRAGQITGLEHELAYRGLVEGSLDVTDTYTTDGQVASFGLTVLRDDKGFFSEYRAAFLMRRSALDTSPALRATLADLDGSIDEAAMTAMNATALGEGASEGRIAREFAQRRFELGQPKGLHAGLHRDRLAPLKEHLVLTGLSLFAAIALAIPLGIVAAKRRRTGQLIVTAVGVIQTIPSLVLLVLMIPLLGIGKVPALVALFLYSLLPIVRNTTTGLARIPAELRESAEALGLPAFARLRLVELPMATPTILAGIKTAAVINVGTATLGALIGAGGLGEPILAGIRTDNTALILEGAIPAAGLALAMQAAFDLAERLFVSKGLRKPVAS